MVVAVRSTGWDPFCQVVWYWIAQTSSLLRHIFGIISPICLQEKDVFSIPIANDVPVFLEMYETPSVFHETMANCNLSFVLICCFAFLRCDLCMLSPTHPPTCTRTSLTYARRCFYQTDLPGSTICHMCLLLCG